MEDEPPAGMPLAGDSSLVMLVSLGSERNFTPLQISSRLLRALAVMIVFVMVATSCRLTTAELLKLKLASVAALMSTSTCTWPRSTPSSTTGMGSAPSS